MLRHLLLYLLRYVMQLEYWKRDEDAAGIREHRIIYVDSTPYCPPSPATRTRHVRALRQTKHREEPARAKSHGTDVTLTHNTNVTFVAASQENRWKERL